MLASTVPSLEDSGQLHGLVVGHAFTDSPAAQAAGAAARGRGGVDRHPLGQGDGGALEVCLGDAFGFFEALVGIVSSTSIPVGESARGGRAERDLGSKGTSSQPVRGGLVNSASANSSGSSQLLAKIRVTGGSPSQRVGLVRKGHLEGARFAGFVAAFDFGAVDDRPVAAEGDFGEEDFRHFGSGWVTRSIA